MSQPALLGVFRLALMLGKTISEMNMSWREFSYWQAYFKIEPPEEGDNKRTAALMAQITNMSGRILPDKRTVKAEDFLSGFAGKVSTSNPQSMQDQIEVMKQMGKSDG